MSIREVGGGLNKGGVLVPCVPTSAFKTALDAMYVAETEIVGTMVYLTFLNNNEVGQATDGMSIDGYIEAYVKDNTATGYTLTVRILHYWDKDGVRHACHDVGEYNYSGSPALKDYVVVDADANFTVAPGSTYGDGAVFSIHTTNSTVLVLMD